MTKPTTASRRAFPWLILVGLALYAAVIWWVGVDAVTATLRAANVLAIAAMAGCIVAGFFVRILKWRYALGPRAPVAPAFFLSKTAGSWSPARLGEFSPLVLRSFRTARVGVWIGADRILEAGMTVAMGLWGFSAVGLMPWCLFSLLCLAGALGCVAAIYLARRMERTSSDDGESRVTRFAAFVSRVRDELAGLGAKLLLLLVLTFVAKLLDLAGVILLYSAFDAEVGWALAAAVRGAHGVLSVMPDATGVPYVADAALLDRVAGIPPEVWSTAIGVEVAVLHALLLLGLGATVAWWKLTARAR